jgi:hypothetical protein
MMAAVAALALLAAFAPLPLRAQAPAAIGTLAGRDASVEHPAAAAVNAATGTPVGNGSVVVVHSGKAHLQFTGGDAISICGPAKFTVLQSGDALTVALEFGRLHISLQDATPLEAYTPFFTALPESTADGHRELTIGLDANGMFCARTIHGGVRLEQQLTGHALVVPEPSETFLQGGDITPLRDPPGHCECDVTLADVTPSPAPSVETENAAAAAGRPPTSSANPAAPAGTAVTAAPLMTTTGSATAPPSPQPAPTAPLPPAPATSAPVPAGAKVIMPALAFDYSSRNPVTPANPDAAALLDQSQVTPGWAFHGTVGKASTGVAPPAPNTVNATQTRSPQQHQGFWSKLKRFFGGG